MVLENDKGICPGYLPAENILTYNIIIIFFLNDDNI